MYFNTDCFTVPRTGTCLPVAGNGTVIGLLKTIKILNAYVSPKLIEIKAYLTYV